MKQRIILGALASLTIPSVCLAHSGTLLRTAMNFMPFLAPIIAVGLTALKKFFRKGD